MGKNLYKINVRVFGVFLIQENLYSKNKKVYKFSLLVHWNFKNNAIFNGLVNLIARPQTEEYKNN